MKKVNKTNNFLKSVCLVILVHFILIGGLIFYNSDLCGNPFKPYKTKEIDEYWMDNWFNSGSVNYLHIEQK